MYRLPMGQETGAEVMGSTSTPYHTDSQGYLQGRGEIYLNDKLIALLPKRSTDSYTLYNASADPGDEEKWDPVEQPGVQTLTISADNPLLLFNLDVALEWDARKDARYLAQLDFDLKRALGTAVRLDGWAGSPGRDSGVS